jgi:hypothetical protein
MTKLKLPPHTILQLMPSRVESKLAMQPNTRCEVDAPGRTEHIVIPKPLTTHQPAQFQKNPHQYNVTANKSSPSQLQNHTPTPLTPKISKKISKKSKKISKNLKNLKIRKHFKTSKTQKISSDASEKNICSGIQILDD